MSILTVLKRLKLKYSDFQSRIGKIISSIVFLSSVELFPILLVLMTLPLIK